MDTFITMRIFVRVAEEGSFTAAAMRLNITTPAVSRAISALEAHLHTRLLNRSTRKVVLTEAGHRYLQRCEQILAVVEQAEAEAADAQVRPTGQLRVHATASFGQTYVTPAIVRFRQRHPSVSVDLTLSQHVPDIIDEGYDVSVQLSADELPDSSLVAQPLGTLHSILCAAPAYLREHGAPRDVHQLSRHACFRFVSPLFPNDRWLLDGPGGTQTVPLHPAGFRVNSADALAVALKDGIGIGAVPMSTAAPALRDGSLVRVLPGYRLQPLNAYALYTSRRYLDAKIKAFVEFLRDVIPQMLESHEADLRDTAQLSP
ncbi:LysR family transcriptional regulator [Paraburkholderia sp. LEh10]|uniref:LysR family transcriptional regulator n=1 Tax=Paraburkholderia sp. LEh10 TaxID=2821353 RepID=UPI001AE849C1|nr:LysR family transcriptional regulator [Paraburkholderia sp. LEh10]MBP0589675.1 LysR family transcriptional regulator [Paraburkholderia sp. LEh10]